MRSIQIIFVIATVFLTQSVLAGTVFTNRTQWEEAVGIPRVSEDFAGIPHAGGLASPVTVAWGTVAADAGNVFGGFAGGLNVGSINVHLIPTDSESVVGFGFDVGGNEFSQVRVRVSDDTSVILDTIVNGQSFFGWKRGASDGFAFVTVNSQVGLVDIFDATFAFKDIHTSIQEFLIQQLDATVSSRASQASLDALDTKVQALQTQFDAMQTQLDVIEELIRNLPMNRGKGPPQ